MGCVLQQGEKVWFRPEPSGEGSLAGSSRNPGNPMLQSFRHAENKCVARTNVGNLLDNGVRSGISNLQRAAGLDFLTEINAERDQPVVGHIAMPCVVVALAGDKSVNTSLETADRSAIRNRTNDLEQPFIIHE